ncbi:hypothetical protein [Nocardia sp. NPDC056100]|uniref:hypothetical protein n=1 Tax=Nocardia sp. NPDC056100 TaxID=3345712 RepID=UPI0035D83365
MALTEREAIVLGRLSALKPTGALTVRQLCEKTGLTPRAARRALHRLTATGLALSTVHNPATWRATERGRVTVNNRRYRDYLVAQAQ